MELDIRLLRYCVVVTEDLIATIGRVPADQTHQFKKCLLCSAWEAGETASLFFAAARRSFLMREAVHTELRLAQPMSQPGTEAAAEMPEEEHSLEAKGGDICPLKSNSLIVSKSPHPAYSQLDPAIEDWFRLFHHIASRGTAVHLSADPNVGMAGRCVRDDRYVEGYRLQHEGIRCEQGSVPQVSINRQSLASEYITDRLKPVRQKENSSIW
jgi:hypothetical protein